MKLKARDIVPGWPRGRSTFDMWPDWRSVWYWMIMCPERAEKIAELQLDRAYHEAQQAMVDVFIERWRQPVPPSGIKFRSIDQDQNLIRFEDYSNFSLGSIQKSLRLIDEEIQRVTGASDDQMAAAWHKSAKKIMNTNFMEEPKCTERI